ncbi:peptidase M3A/M3B, partial [Kipferlia bialata]
EDRMDRVYGIVSHLNGVCNSDELRAVYSDAQQKMVAYGTKLSQSRPVFNLMKHLLAQLPEASGEVPLEGEGLEMAARRRLLEHRILNAELNGVGLEDDKRERFKALKAKEAALATEFRNNVLDATKAYVHLSSDKAEVAGMPASALMQAAQTAVDRGLCETADAEEGPWALTLDAPAYLAVQKHCSNSSIRKMIHEARITRATALSPCPILEDAKEGEETGAPKDNLAVLEKILVVRQECAALLGYASYAEANMNKKMAGSVQTVDDLLDMLVDASEPASVKEMEALASLAGLESVDKLHPWDVTFWTERLRESRFGLNDEDLKPYFSFESVLKSLFALVDDLFGVSVSEVTKEQRQERGIQVWHETVRLYQLSDKATGDVYATMYCDPFVRPATKRGGAWMNTIHNRGGPTGIKGAYNNVRPALTMIVCNQSPPVDGKPSLMTHREVETLFHEFGHALQGSLCRVCDLPQMGGIDAVEWDCVELPSQFMENYCYDRHTLSTMARHYESGAALPDETVSQIMATKTFMQGYGFLRQCYYAKTDMELHARYRQGATEETAIQVQHRMSQVLPVKPDPNDCFIAAFTHMFGGYGAGYYSYKYAEVLSADAYAAFEEADQTPDAQREVGKRYRNTVLSLGGAVHPREVFRLFRGRDTDPASLLRHAGLKV